MYRVSAGAVTRGAAASLVAGAVIGAIWGVLLPPGGGLGFFFLFFAVIIGPPLGYFFANILDRATGRKRGPVMQGIAVAGLIVAWIVHAVVGGAFQNDLFGLVLTAAASAGAISRLR